MQGILLEAWYVRGSTFRLQRFLDVRAPQPQFVLVMQNCSVCTYAVRKVIRYVAHLGSYKYDIRFGGRLYSSLSDRAKQIRGAPLL